MKVVTQGIQTSCVWIARLAYLNLIWLLFVLAGLIVLGFFPATAAGYQITRDWVHNPRTQEEPLFRRFAALFRANLIRANVAGGVAVAIGVLLFTALRLGWAATGAAWQVPLVGGAVIASVAFLGGLVHLPFLVAHMDAPARSLVRSSWLYALAHPGSTLIICAAWTGLCFALGAFPAAALFFSFTPIALLTAILDVRGFRRIEQRHALTVAT
ncbi:putative membrane protein YesL [Microbacterium sp. SORGH_AS 1204]|uniref:YesL family protein n=1 Tax=Microbacterium sp. SORGH_AS_1204 TaxID=3041785 RepID=UPI002794B493|nr:DUF624 domain-containing protein [Microbacterium sp. SORGH_AS_1204]MDQ1138148.1 putative membrane protein YesL [Microbacterium sp. SORGH_AS_1204]